MKYTYCFDQLRDQPAENIYRLFADYDTQLRDFDGIDLDRYFTADNGVVEAPDEITACEHLFLIYNADRRPEGYTGRSMSVSDVVRLWDNSVDPPVKTTWFCDSFGFKRLEV